MKFNTGIAMLGLFVAAVVGGGALLLNQPDGTAKALPPQSATGEFAKPGAAPTQVATAPAAAPTPKDERFVIKRILPIDGPIKYGKWHWDDANVPDGPIVITVDLDARVLSVFKGGYEIGATAVLLGTSEKPTPLGEFPIKWKKADHYSSIYDQAPMPFTQNLTDDGVAIHGTKVEKGYASHGCIGVPDDFGRKLFGVTKLGDKVIITKGKTAKQGDSLI
jgi:lipoprotein-anchoring transpeptidase ErfK/SrfK